MFDASGILPALFSLKVHIVKTPVAACYPDVGLCQADCIYRGQ